MWHWRGQVGWCRRHTNHPRDIHPHRKFVMISLPIGRQKRGKKSVARCNLSALSQLRWRMTKTSTPTTWKEVTLKSKREFFLHFSPFLSERKKDGGLEPRRSIFSPHFSTLSTKRPLYFPSLCFLAPWLESTRRESPRVSFHETSRFFTLLRQNWFALRTFQWKLSEVLKIKSLCGVKL